ncbi:MAG: glycosyltransferase [Hyphomicrobiaceae bacterium]|nr:glycosyltransferase [Hyphomicrobiaceae bacterium]
MSDANLAHRAAIRRVAIVAPVAAAFLDELSPLVGRLLAGRHRVFCLAPDLDEATAQALAYRGADSAALPITPERWSLLPERKLVGELAGRLSAWQADVMFAAGGDTIARAAAAASKAQIETIVVLADRVGLDTGSANRRVLERACQKATGILCHNHDDAARLEISGLCPPALPPPAVLPGFGVDLSQFDMISLPPLTNGLTFLMVADLDRARGVLDFAAAASLAKAQAPQARFLLLHRPARSDDPVHEDELVPFADAIEIVRPGTSISDALMHAHVFVYPSHAEAMPQRVLEALATARPVITTATPGCRETVDERVNGVLVPPGDKGALARALGSFLKRPDLIPAMARASRQKAERRFDRSLAMDATLAVLGLDE